MKVTGNVDAAFDKVKKAVADLEKVLKGKDGGVSTMDDTPPGVPDDSGGGGTGAPPPPPRP